MRYNILVNQAVPFYRALANVEGVKQTFMEEFAIDLVWTGGHQVLPALDQLAGCLRMVYPDNYCNESCGHCTTGSDCQQSHHRSTERFIRISPGNRQIAHFRFVNFRLCTYITPPFPHFPIHIGDRVNGAAFRLRYDLIVSTHLGNELKTTAHEIAHLFGARDWVCTPNQECIMHPDFDVHNRWCDRCRSDILNYRNRS